MVEREEVFCVESWGKNLKSVWWNDEIKAELGEGRLCRRWCSASDEETKDICMEVYREEKREVKRCIIQSKKKVNKQFGRKMKGCE